jgi:hypothetical protein
MLALTNIQWVGTIWLGTLIAVPLVLWRAHRRWDRPDWNELEQTAPRPSGTAVRLAPRSYDHPTPAERAEIARLEKLYAAPAADR